MRFSPCLCSALAVHWSLCSPHILRPYLIWPKTMKWRLRCCNGHRRGCPRGSVEVGLIVVASGRQPSLGPLGLSPRMDTESAMSFRGLSRSQASSSYDYCLISCPVYGTSPGCVTASVQFNVNIPKMCWMWPPKSQSYLASSRVEWLQGAHT